MSFVHIVDGGWSSWINISECSVTCGKGVKVQSRSCTEPPKSCGGIDCIGEDIQLQPCSVSSCCPGV